MVENIAMRIIQDKRNRAIKAFRSRGFEFTDNEWSQEVGAWEVLTESDSNNDFLDPSATTLSELRFDRSWRIGVRPLGIKSLLKNANADESSFEELYGESLADIVEYGDGNDPDTVLNFNFPAGATIKVQDRDTILDCIRTSLEESDEVYLDATNENAHSDVAGLKPTDMPGRGMRKGDRHSMMTLSAFLKGNGANGAGDAQRDILKRIVESSKTLSIYYVETSMFHLPEEKSKSQVIDEFMRVAERYVNDIPDEELYLQLPAGLLPAGDASRLLMRLDGDTAEDAASVITRLSNFASGSLDEARSLAQSSDLKDEAVNDDDSIAQVVSELEISDLAAAGELFVDSFVSLEAYKKLASFDGTSSDFRDALIEQVESLESVAKLQIDVRRAIMFAQEELPARREQLSESLAEVTYGQKGTFTEGVFDDYIDDAAVSDDVYDVVSDYALECFDACKKELTDRIGELFDESGADAIIMRDSRLKMNPDKLLSEYDSSNEDLFSGFESFEGSIQLPYKTVDEDAVYEQMLADVREVMPSGQYTETSNGVRLNKRCSLSEARNVAAKIRDHERLGRLAAENTDLRLKVDYDSLRGLDEKKIAKYCTERFSKEFDGLPFYMNH